MNLFAKHFIMKGKIEKSSWFGLVCGVDDPSALWSGKEAIYLLNVVESEQKKNKTGNGGS